jgi:nitrogen regulatory protein P-II 1
MKRIEAIIRKTKFEDVKKALHEADIDFFSYWDVRGVGNSRKIQVIRGVSVDTGSIDRILISFVLRDVNVDKTINAILKSAKTGEVGDGKIFISSVEESIRIRTGEKGDESLYIKD